MKKQTIMATLVLLASTALGQTSLPTGTALKMKLERMAHSELRALERAIEILERGY